MPSTPRARLATYSFDPENQDAAAFLAQLELAVDANVLYLDGGWQVLADGQGRSIGDQGRRIRTGTRVARLVGERRITGVETDAGETLQADAVVLTIEPSACARFGARAWSSPCRRCRSRGPWLPSPLKTGPDG